MSMPLNKILFAFLCLHFAGCAFGAPTKYEKHRSEQKTECELRCEKAHTEADKENRRRCARICEAKKELESASK